MRHLKKLLILIVAFAIFASCLMVFAFADALAYGAATVSASTLNVRSGPGTDKEIKGTLQNGTKVVVLEQTNENWCKINHRGLVGYVSTDFLKDVVTAENFEATGNVVGSDVRMRSGPSTINPVILTTEKNAKVDIIGINNGWYKVKYKDSVGYIRSDFVKIGSGVSAGGSSDIGQQIADFAQQYVGYSYVYGAESPSRGFDCSGLVYYCYGQFGYNLSRTASQQYKNNGTTISKSDLEPGDLVFFSSYGSGVTHVGIYIGNDQFVHASTSKTGVIISDLNSSYYTRVWYGAKRIV